MPVGVGPTPDRYTRLYLRPGTQPKLIRPYFHMTRSANEIGLTGASQTFQTTNALNLGAGWFVNIERRWITLGNDPFFSKAAGEVETVSDGFDVKMFKENTLPGVGADASVIPSGLNGVRRRIPAGSDFNKNLSADAAAYVSPVIPGTLTPMNRIMHTKITFKQNRPFGFLVWDLNDDVPSGDAFFGIGFGGRNSTLPVGTRGGEFYLGVLADGSAYLYENNALNTWDLIDKFKAFNKSSDNKAKVYQVIVVPLDDRTIHFKFERKVSIFSEENEDNLGGNNNNGRLSIGFGNTKVASDTYTHNVRLRGYTPVGGITGNGAVRIDARRDLRGPFGIAGLKFKASGYVTDAPFQVNDELPAATPIRVRIYGFTAFGTSILAQAYNGETGAALTQTSFAYGGDSGVGIYTFASAAGIKKYFIRFLLTSNADATRTPVFYGYDVSVGGGLISQATSPQNLGQILSVRTTGPDFDSGQDGASITMESIRNTHNSLRNNGHIEAKINVYNTNTDALISTLFEGEIIRPEFNQISSATTGYPYVRMWNMNIKSLWTKVERYINQQNRDLNPEDNRAPRNADGQWFANKVTDVIRFVIGEVGFAPSEINIPDIDLRFWPSPGGGSNHLTWEAGQGAGELIQYLAMRYLNATVLWDPNCGSGGQWRLVFNPYGTPSASLGNFYASPNVGAKYASSSGAYTNGTFIIRKTYSEEVIPPAANKIVVWGLVPGGGASGLFGSASKPGAINVTMYNHISYPFIPGYADSTHIDYIGEVIPYEVVDPTLSTIEACQWFARTLMQQIGHGRRMAKWRSPLLLITNEGDAAQVRPRPLRFGDPITLLAQPAWVRSCNISIPRSDKIQMMDMEAWYA